MIALKTRIRRHRARLTGHGLPDFLFIHINKTGGTSIKRALGIPHRLQTAKEVLEEIGRRQWKKRFSFSFVRNPWDKVASHYAYRVQTNQTGLGERPVGFNEWVRLAYDEQDPRYYDQPKMFMAQTDWLTDENKEMVVRFVGRFESLGEDFSRVCEALGRDVKLPHLKRSSRGDYRTMYDSGAVEIVTRRFADDLARFGYSFE